MILQTPVSQEGFHSLSDICVHLILLMSRKFPFFFKTCLTENWLSLIRKGGGKGPELSSGTPSSMKRIRKPRTLSHLGFIPTPLKESGLL